MAAAAAAAPSQLLGRTFSLISFEGISVVIVFLRATQATHPTRSQLQLHSAKRAIPRTRPLGPATVCLGTYSGTRNKVVCGTEIFKNKEAEEKLTNIFQ